MPDERNHPETLTSCISQGFSDMRSIERITEIRKKLQTNARRMFSRWPTDAVNFGPEDLQDAEQVRL